MTVHTAGHSTLALDDFLALLDVHGIRGIADVRRHPGSRRHPHFAREPLEASLARAGIAYLWIPELGGRRRPRPDSPHRAWKVEAFRGYADHLDTAEFRTGMDRLLAFATERPTALLCAEALHTRCHRRLIADALVVRNVDVLHLRKGSTPEPHRLPPFARVDDGHLIYDVETQAILPGTG
jgi:uncharacterized protein (DUF488 family)